MSELTHLTLTQARAGLRAKKFSVDELLEAHVSALASHRDLNAFITETADLARAQARTAADRLQRGEAGVLVGGEVVPRDAPLAPEVA